MTTFDAVTLEVLWTRGISIVDEAAKAIVRTSFSTLSNEANDFACMLTDARGFAPDDPVAAEGGEPEVLANFRAAREITRLAESGADLSPGDIAPAVEDYREVYRILTEQRAVP